MQLINRETYEHEVKLKKSEMNGGEDTPHPVFMLSRLTSFEVDRIDDATSVLTTKSSDIRVMVGKVKSLKIEYAVRDWKNVSGKDGKPAKCNNENKKLLPLGVRERLLEHIDEINGLSKQDEDTEKN